MTLDLDDLENKTRYAMTVPTCVVTKAELAALVRIAKAAQLVNGTDDDSIGPVLEELFAAGLPIGLPR